MSKVNFKIISVIACTFILSLLLCLCGCESQDSNSKNNSSKDDGGIPSCSGKVASKPVIYLYPDKIENVSVKVFGADLTCTYPEYNDGWNVIASPDGSLKAGDKEYYCLYWEGNIGDNNINYNDGFCVSGSDTASFLDSKLEEIGLNPREREEFIIYWLPRMQNNPYNLIYFDVNPDVTLNIDPAPDNVIRVYMHWKPSNNFVSTNGQYFHNDYSRSGFTVVEWGGVEE